MFMKIVISKYKVYDFIKIVYNIFRLIATSPSYLTILKWLEI